MCLGIPGWVVELVEGYAGQLAVVDVEGARRQINVGMLDRAPDPGAWVLIHMGFAVELIDEERARTALSGLELMGRPRELGQPAGLGRPAAENSMQPREGLGRPAAENSMQPREGLGRPAAEN